MKAVLQRVKSAFITVDEHVISSIGEGLLVLVGVYKDSTKKEADSMVERILKAELWPEENSDNDSWVKNIQDIKGEVLCVPQFTLQDALEKGEMYEKADALAVRQLYDYFIEQLREAYQPDQVNNGVLETKMDVELLDDTPIRFDYHSADETVKITINTQMAKETEEFEAGEAGK